MDSILVVGLVSLIVLAKVPAPQFGVHVVGWKEREMFRRLHYGHAHDEEKPLELE